jgi:protein involved in polysaccharide export with SLBB domain
MVNVLVSGAVVNVGHHDISAPATVEAALKAAGGLARRTQMWPAGPITIRRPLGNRKVDVWRFNLADPEPQAWKQFELQSGDAVIFQWQIEGG